MKFCSIFRFLAGAWVFSSLLSCPARAAAEGVQIKELDGKLRIEAGGKLFAEYVYADVPRPFFYPLYGPGGAMMTRHWPMKEAPDEAQDHVHHRSLWYAHGDVNGHDFWSEGAKAGKTVHVKFTKIESGKETGVIRSENQLISRDGQVVCTDTRTMKIHHRPGARILDFEITIHASHGPVNLGDTKEGTMAIRIAETMRLKGKVGQGHIVNSEGQRDGETWGKRAKWCHYSGPVEGKTVGIAIFDHPDNPRHPTWWHVRDYGLFAANPFGIHDFERLPQKTEGFKIAEGQSATWRYRFYFHEGDEKQGQVARHYEQYVQESKP